MNIRFLSMLRCNVKERDEGDSKSAEHSRAGRRRRRTLAAIPGRRAQRAGYRDKTHANIDNPCYKQAMSKATIPPRSPVDEFARERGLEMEHLQIIEGNPLTADEIAMFEMFEREGWSHERRRAHVLALFQHRAAPAAAE